MAHTTTNQQQAAATEERTERRCNKQEAHGKHNTIAFGGGKVKGRDKILNYIIDSNGCQWNMETATTNQKQAGTEEPRMGRGTDAREQEQDVQDACAMSASDRGR